MNWINGILMMRFLLQGICWSSLLNVLEENWSTHFPLQRKNKVEPLTLYSTDITAIIFKIQTFLPSPNWPAREWILTNSNQFRSSSAISPTPGQQILSRLSSCSTRSSGVFCEGRASPPTAGLAARRTAPKKLGTSWLLTGRSLGNTVNTVGMSRHPDA